MEDRLLAMGRWLEVNGEAIYATTRGPKQTPEMKAARTYLTRKDGSLVITPPTFAFGRAPCDHALVYKITRGAKE